MEKKLEALEEKYASLAERLESTEIMSDMAAYAKCMKEYKALTPIIDKYHEYKTALADLKDAEEIAAETDDAEMRALAQEQSAQSRLAIDRCLGELKLLLLPRDPNDDKNVIVEIRSGAAGTRRRCSPTSCIGCIRCTPKNAASKPSCSMSTKPS